MTFWKKLKLLPPIACRLMARHRWKGPLSSQEIAKASGLSVVRVDSLSELTTWDAVDIATFRAFTKGCGVDFFNCRQTQRVKKYLDQKPPKFSYLRKSPLWSYYRGLLARWRESLLQ